MPTSSQALIVITDEGDDPRIPRRHYPATASSYPVLNIGNSDRTSSRSKLPGLKNTTKRSGFQNLVDVKGYRGTISYDATTKALRWLVAAQQTRGNVPLAPNGNVPLALNGNVPLAPNGNVPLAPNGNVPLAPNGNVPLVPNVKTITGTDKATPPCYIDHTDQWATSRSNNTLEYQASEKRRAQLETLGVRKRTSGLVAGQSSRDIISCSSTVLPKGAKFMPSPPGQKSRPIPVGNYSRDNVGDMCTPNAVNDRMSSMEAHSSIDDANIGMKSFEFVFMFNKSTGSPKVFYLMVDPIGKCRLFPKTNTVLFPKLKNLVNFRAVVLDDCLYIIGGKDWETGEHIDKTWRYDPANSRWSQRASLINARCRHTATVLNGCIYITGGEVIGGRVTESCECYDPVKDKWTEILDLPRPRADHAACANGLNLYASGGISNLKHQCSNVFWTYDPITNEWTEPLPGVILPHEREKHNMISVGKRVVVIGGRGFDQETFSEKDEGAVCSYNTHTKGNARKDGIWDIFHPNVFNPRGNAGVVLLGRNLYLIGGKSYQKDCDVRMVECYNTKRRKIRESFQLPDSFSYVNVDCVVLKVPITNTDINFDDILLYDKYIMW